MKARSKELLNRAIAAMLAAIDVYNKPDHPYRAESFTILSINGWELLLKAKWLDNHDNKLSSLFELTGKKRPRYKRTRSGNFKTYGIDYLAKKLTDLNENARRNLVALVDLRDTSVHFYNRSGTLAEHLQELGMACIKNFAAAVQDWFDDDLSRFNFYLMPLSFVKGPDSVEAVALNIGEKNFVNFINNLKPDSDDPSERYSVTVNVEVRLVRSKAQDALGVRTTNDPNAPAVRVTEEQIRDRYPWDYRELTRRLQERYAGFKANKQYHDLRRDLQADERYAHTRRLNPDNPKSASQTFFNSNILKEFDLHYQRRR